MNWSGARKPTVAIFFIFVVYLGAANESLFAATRYVSDRLIVSVRAGQGNTSNVLGYIQSDTPVDVLEENGGYLKIKTENGLAGWVNAKYITSEKPKALIIRDLRDEINHLQKTISPASISSTEQSYEQKLNELARAIKKHQQLALNREDELEKLKSENANLKSKLSHLKNPNKNRVELNGIHWFLAGAGVLLFGFMVGRSARKEKRTSIFR